MFLSYFCLNEIGNIPEIFEWNDISTHSVPQDQCGARVSGIAALYDLCCYEQPNAHVIINFHRDRYLFHSEN